MNSVNFSPQILICEVYALGSCLFKTIELNTSIIQQATADFRIVCVNHQDNLTIPQHESQGQHHSEVLK